MEKKIIARTAFMIALGVLLSAPAGATTTGGLDTPAGVSSLPIQAEGQQAIVITATDATAGTAASIDFLMPTNLHFPLTAGSTTINTNGAITIGNTTINADGSLTSNGTFNFNNAGSNGWITINGGTTQIASWGGTNLATSFGTGYNQQLVISNSNDGNNTLNASFFPWTAPGTLSINGTVAIDNPSHTANLCLNGVCTTSIGGVGSITEQDQCHLNVWPTGGQPRVTCSGGGYQSSISGAGTNWMVLGFTSGSNHSFCVMSLFDPAGADDNICQVDGTPGGPWTMTISSFKGSPQCRMTCFN